MDIILPDAFGEAIESGIGGLLGCQGESGAIMFNGDSLLAKNQQAIFPMAYCYAARLGDGRYYRSEELSERIKRLGDFLVEWCDDKGGTSYKSDGGYDMPRLDQRLTYAWTEAYRICKKSEGCEDFGLDGWAAIIERGCEKLIEGHLKKLAEVKKFTVHGLGTGTNHVVLHVSTVYRAGMVLGRDDFCEAAIGVGRAMAEWVHEDGYWEEHSDLRRLGGPTPLYNYLSHCGMALMYEWTGEAVFGEAVERSTRFHGNFSYPDGSFFDLIDERVRYHKKPMLWGLFGFSGCAEGRGLARNHFKGWLDSHSNGIRKAKEKGDSVGDDVAGGVRFDPENMARLCENHMYWHEGEVGEARSERVNHEARLKLEAGMYRRGKWSVGVSGMRATTPEDPVYRENPFALERQKLFNLWHEKVGMVVDGSNSKYQPENSTFAAKHGEVLDYWPVDGEIFEGDGGEVGARAVYRMFEGRVGVQGDNDEVVVELSVEQGVFNGVVCVGFTMLPVGKVLKGREGREYELGSDEFEVGGDELGGGFVVGDIEVEGPEGMRVGWPMLPFNSYATDGKSDLSKGMIRVWVELGVGCESAVFKFRVVE